MLKVALIGLGKMGLSHQALINAHPDVDLVAVCDTAEYVLDVLRKYTKVRVYTDYVKLLDEEELDAVVIATPSRFHTDMVQECLDRDLNVFCEKPFCLDPDAGLRLAELAESKNLINQVGYHYRFVGPFNEAKRVIDANLIGDIHHIKSEAYGPVVLRKKGKTWRSSKNEGGGCLYDYACHAIDLMNYLVGPPKGVGTSVLNRVFSAEVEDEVYSTFFYENGASGQLTANWSDQSRRKMSTRVLVWGTKGKIQVDRQEVQVYLNEDEQLLPQYGKGWNVRYVTELTEPVYYYLRGEEYSAQIDHFVHSIKTGAHATRSTFRSAVDTDRVAAAIVRASRYPAVDVVPKGDIREMVSSGRALARGTLWSRLRGWRPQQSL